MVSPRALRATSSARKLYTTQRITTTAQRHFTTSPKLHLDDSGSRLPRIANPSLWASFVPKFLRRPTSPLEAAERSRAAKLKALQGPKEWNPYTIFIILGVLVGSNAVNLIALRNDTLNFNRKTDARLELLREVVQRVKDGEEVDVKRLLGTGDPEREKEWEEVMQELEGTDMVWEGKMKRERRIREKAEAKRVKDEERQRDAVEVAKRREEEVGTEGKVKSTARPTFVM